MSDAKARQLLNAADDTKIPFMTWKADVHEFLRQPGADYAEDDLPAKKGDLIAALELIAERNKPEDDGEPVADDAVEVMLPHPYCPQFLMTEEGRWEEQDEVTRNVPAGLAYLRRDEAQRALMRRQAEITPNTMKQLEG